MYERHVGTRNGPAATAMAVAMPGTRVVHYSERPEEQYRQMRKFVRQMALHNRCSWDVKGLYLRNGSLIVFKRLP